VDAFETESARQCGTSRGRSFGDGIVLWGHSLAAACERTIQKERSRPRWVRLAQSRKRVGMPAFCRGPRGCQESRRTEHEFRARV